MSGESTKEVLPGIQEAILGDLKSRFERGSHIHGFVLDSVARMHPVDVSSAVEGELNILSSLDAESVQAMEPDEAWRYVNHLTTATAVPYKNPVDLYHKPTIGSDLVRAVSLFDAIAFLVSQRRGLTHNALFTGPLISEELVNGNEDQISVEEAAKGMLTYHSYTVPNQTLSRDKIVHVSVKSTQGASSETSEIAPDIIICIPVANGQEHDTLPHTLKLLAEQSLHPNKFEIVLLHNTRISKEMYKLLSSDNPADAFADLNDEIYCERRWLHEIYGNLLNDYPQLRIRADFEVHDPYASIGYCRNQLGDNVALTYINRGSTNNPLLLNMDADIRTLNKDFLRNMLTTADETELPVIASRVRWRAGESAKVGPYTEKLMRLSQFIHSVSCSYAEVPDFTDSGTAIRLKEYCLTGGHYWPDQFAESIRIAQLLSRARKENGQEQTVAISRGSIFGSHPRRQVDVLARGFPPSMAWKKGVTTFGEINDQVRTQSTPYEKAEAVAAEELERLIKDMVEDSLGNVQSKGFEAKEDVLRKGLTIIGLPDHLPVPDRSTSA